ncbi:MAG: hypothetical protein DMD94_07455 [Candidatus Rokuibacteriota bacterium]|nr:MAG: hypothetical protein DMD94_07455 [Candidatus Rokubacteria bacterium]TMC30272.1 MAG: hypothetical protein E6J24_16310 [Chloroflexota bacterium]
MGFVRRILPEDVLRVAQLYAKVFGHRTRALDGLQAALHEVFFCHPWPDDRLPSLVYEASDGRILGCLGVVPRPMSMNGRSIVAAVSHTVMVDPDGRATLAGVELIRAFLSGSQDLSISQCTTESRRIFEAVGGTTSLLHSMGWTRILRPSRYVLGSLRGRGLAGGIAAALTPVCRAADALAGRIRPFRRSATGLSAEPLEPETLGTCVSELARDRALRPIYDAGSLKWLLDLLGRQTGDAALRGTIVRDARAEIVGGYLYYQGATGVGDVVQIVAHPKSIDAVLDHLFSDAHRRGLTAVSGLLDSRLFPALGAKHCLFTRGDGSWLMAHSRDPEILRAIHRGDAFLTRLEAEWWIGFVLIRSLALGGSDVYRS